MESELKTAEILAILENTPVCFAAVAGELGSELASWRPEKTTWSLSDNLAHIWACADVWGETIEQMLAREEPDLPHVHPRDYMRQQKYHLLEYENSFSVFQEQRQHLLARLYGLTPGEWERGAMIRTKVVNRRHTVNSQVLRMALHEKEHCRQIHTLVQVHCDG